MGGEDELAAAGTLPAVIGRGPDGIWRLLLGPAALDACRLVARQVVEFATMARAARPR